MAKWVPPEVHYTLDPIGLWWCNSHNRRATHIRSTDRQHCCAPGQSGILLPCNSINLTDEIELVIVDG